MTDWMRWFLPVFLPLSGTLIFFGSSFLVWRRTGINPLVLRRTNDTRGYVARLLGIAELAMGISIVLLALGHERFPGVFDRLHCQEVHMIGAVLLMASTTWTLIAQAQMGDAWRIGIDDVHRTELVTSGLFRISRNPIFLAMHVGFVAVFLALPSIVTLIVLVVGHIAINVQVYLEEAHMQASLGDVYAAYQRRVRRWL